MRKETTNGVRVVHRGLKCPARSRQSPGRKRRRGSRQEAASAREAHGGRSDSVSFALGTNALRSIREVMAKNCLDVVKDATKLVREREQ